MSMNASKDPSLSIHDVVTIHSTSDARYWSQYFSISPFTLFQLLKIVGNNVNEIGEFLHSHHEARRLNQLGKSKEYIIL
jgi:hypothetical protein